MDGVFIKWHDADFNGIIARMRHIGCLCCRYKGVKSMPTEEELEERITEHIDGQALAQAFERAARDMVAKKGKGGEQ